MRELLNIKTRERIIEFCNKLINHDFTVQDIIKSIDMMGHIVFRILPTPKFGTLYVSTELGILIEDILGMGTISNDEKEQAILELVEDDMEKLKALARQIILQIESDLKEAEENGYCRKLIE
ncbi:hypothetical protein [Candidatus Tisiphia endosymbiont of Hybos culiciformis]|uniref:hypothetical protein n=1 Tax=Candidatus Tisiphia endosymbiont of Hybos culiciformis TaxID=3139331 RepID=UPI003CCAF98C